jgi:dolichol-phosphate mannosyltransferase
MPLKAIVRGHSYGIVPIAWRGRASGASKLSLQEMGSRYLFIVLYVFLEHHLARGDYRTKRPPNAIHERPKDDDPERTAGHQPGITTP